MNYCSYRIHYQSRLKLIKKEEEEKVHIDLMRDILLFWNILGKKLIFFYKLIKE